MMPQKTLSDIFFATDTVHCGIFIEQIKKICHIHLKVISELLILCCRINYVEKDVYYSTMYKHVIHHTKYIYIHTQGCIHKIFSSRSFVKSRWLWVRKTHMMGISPPFLGGPGACSPGKLLKTGTLEKN